MTKERVKALAGATAWYAQGDYLAAIPVTAWHIRLGKAIPILANDPPVGSHLFAYRTAADADIVAWGAHGQDSWRLLSPSVLQRSFNRLTPGERADIAAIRTRTIPASSVKRLGAVA